LRSVLRAVLLNHFEPYCKHVPYLIQWLLQLKIFVRVVILNSIRRLSDHSQGTWGWRIEGKLFDLLLVLFIIDLLSIS
jgi:hypothetical protein